MTEPAPPVGVGASIRTLRTRQRLSTRALARLAGVSQSLLSKVENGVALPSVASLYAIAEALGVGPADLLPAGGEKAAGHGIPLPPAEADSDPVKTLLLHAAPGRRIEAYRVEYAAGHGDEGPFRHPGEDVVHVLAGRATLRCGSSRLVLAAGDTVWLDGTAPHRIVASRAGDAVVLIVTVR